MKEDELISKKDLLKLTGISYGQLYRWKRQDLIPEAWFIKQSSFTGQETFFPKEKVLERIDLILQLKDQHSLEELAELLSPQSTAQSLNFEELKDLQRFDQAVFEMFARVFNRNQFAFRELIFIDILSKLKRQNGFSDQELEETIRTVQMWLPNLAKGSYRFVLCKNDGGRFSFLIEQNSLVFFDSKTIEERVFDLEELAKELSLELNSARAEG